MSGWLGLSLVVVLLMIIVLVGLGLRFLHWLVCGLLYAVVWLGSTLLRRIAGRRKVSE